MLKPVNVTWGTDPEGFFARESRIIGSEKLVPERGLRVVGAGSIQRDGVQFELHPNPGELDSLGENIAKLLARTFRAARETQAEVVFDGVVTVERKELDSLSEGSRRLGCMPSYNVYGDKPITVDPETYPKRSAGGHIHFGLPSADLKEVRRKMVYLCDILIGMPSVLVDRDPGAAERRENYGRAGECRFPDHGLEYRTTSNFWLRDYVLMSFVFGMAGVATSIVDAAVKGNQKPWDELANRVNIDKVQEAIDANNFQMAYKQYSKLLPFFDAWLPATGFPVNPRGLATYKDMARAIAKKGIDSYFPLQTLEARWTNGRQSFRNFVS